MHVANWTLRGRCEAHRLALWADEETHRGLARQPTAHDKVIAMWAMMTVIKSVVEAR